MAGEPRARVWYICAAPSWAYLLVTAKSLLVLTRIATLWQAETPNSNMKFRNKQEIEEKLCLELTDPISSGSRKVEVAGAWDPRCVTVWARIIIGASNRGRILTSRGPVLGCINTDFGDLRDYFSAFFRALQAEIYIVPDFVIFQKRLYLFRMNQCNFLKFQVRKYIFEHLVKKQTFWIFARSKEFWEKDTKLTIFKRFVR